MALCHKTIMTTCRRDTFPSSHSHYIYTFQKTQPLSNAITIKPNVDCLHILGSSLAIYGNGLQTQIHTLTICIQPETNDRALFYVKIIQKKQKSNCTAIFQNSQHSDTQRIRHNPKTDNPCVFLPPSTEYHPNARR